MVDELIRAAGESVARDLIRVLGEDALAELAEALRAEEPSGALGTGTLYLLDALEEHLGTDGPGYDDDFPPLCDSVAAYCDGPYDPYRD